MNVPRPLNSIQSLHLLSPEINPAFNGIAYIDVTCETLYTTQAFQSHNLEGYRLFNRSHTQL